MSFETYFMEIVSKTDRLYYNYQGINRKEYPKWEGWKVITKYKEQDVDIKKINDETLDVLVRNFYYLKYLEERFK